MQEVEVKILEVDVPAVVKRLESLGAKRVADEQIDAILFNAGKDVLRLRKKGDVVEFCHKKSLHGEGVKAMQETEVLVSDFDTMHEMLLSLGFTEKRRIRKHRVSYALGDIHYEFDTIPGIPTFLEVEAHDERSLRKAVDALGFSMEQTVTYGNVEVLKHYGK